MANLLVNGDFEASTGVGATSGVGPVWQTDYLVPAGGQLFSGAGAGQARYAFFTTNAGQVCNNFPNALTLPALGARSMAVNVGGVGQDIIRWTNIHLINGARYRIAMDAGVVNPPFSVAMAIDGVSVLAVPAPPMNGAWFNTQSEFTWTGTTGPHTVSLRTNTGAAAGNDHAFDNFVLERQLVLPVVGCCTNTLVCYQDVTPCDVTPTQSAGSNINVFNSATMQNNTGRPMRQGGVPCGSSNITDQQAADRLIDGNLSGFTGNIVFLQPLPPTTGTDPIPASFDLMFTVPRDNITHFRLYHGYGGVLNDFDGISGGQVRLFNPGGGLIAGPIAINANNTGAPVDTVLPGGPYNDVARVVLDNITRWGADGRCSGLREVQLLGGWQSTLTWQCGGRVFTALVQGAAAGVTVAGGNLTQTGGPHTMTFSVNNGTDFEGTITTNTPGMFSTLTFDQDNPEVTISGGGTATFAVSFAFATPVRRAIANLSETPPELRDAMTGEVLTDGQFEIVPCGRRDLVS